MMRRKILNEFLASFPRPKCYACKDNASRVFREKPVCDVCFAELAHGEVVNQNINFFGGDAATMEDDGGPSWHNGVRALEE